MVSISVTNGHIGNKMSVASFFPLPALVSSARCLKKSVEHMVKRSEYSYKRCGAPVVVSRTNSAIAAVR